MQEEAIPIPYLKRGDKEIRIGSKVRIPKEICNLGNIQYPLDVVVETIYEEWDNKKSMAYYGYLSEDYGATQIVTECGKYIPTGEEFENIEIIKY